MSKLFALAFLLFPCLSLHSVTIFNNTQKKVKLWDIEYHTMFPRPSYDKQIRKEQFIAQERYRKANDDVSEGYLQPGEIITKNQIKSFRLAVNENPSSWAYIVWGKIEGLDDYIGLSINEGCDGKIRAEKFIGEGSTIFNNTLQEITVNYIDSKLQNQTKNIAPGESVPNIIVHWANGGHNEWKKCLHCYYSSSPNPTHRLNGTILTDPSRFWLDLLIISRDEVQGIKTINHFQ